MLSFHNYHNLSAFTSQKPDQKINLNEDCEIFNNLISDSCFFFFFIYIKIHAKVS